MENSSARSGLSSTLPRIADHYRNAFGWATEVCGDVLQVRLGDGLAAFMVRPADLGRISDYITKLGDPCVSLRLPARKMSVAVLVDARDHVAELASVPVGLTLLPLDSMLPLPPSQLPEGRSHWLGRPDETRRWLPNAATVLAAVHSLRRTAPQRRSRRVEPRDRALMEDPANNLLSSTLPELS